MLAKIAICSATSGSIELLGGPVTGIGCGCGFAIGNCTPSRTVASRKSFPPYFSLCSKATHPQKPFAIREKGK